jgi:MFS-type transporter involved in bile tolerance (Atg22 family)
LSSPDSQSVRPVRKREIFAWTLYDWANSSYSTLLITIVVVYLTNVVMPGTSGQLMYSYGIGGTMFVAALFSPVIGAIADARATKAVFFRWTTIPGCLAAAALGLVSPENSWLFGALFLVSNVGYELSWGMYNAFLPEIADQQSMNRVSSYGFAMGYVGGGLALLIAIVVLQFGGALGLPEGEPLERDYLLGRQVDFAVALPDGQYDVTVTLGDLRRDHKDMSVSLQGKEVEKVSSSEGEFVSRTFPVSIPSDLKLDARDLGDSKTDWTKFLVAQVASADPEGVPAVLNGLKIEGPTLKAPLVFDFGMSVSPALEGSYWVTADAKDRFGEKDADWLREHRKKTQPESQAEKDNAANSPSGPAAILAATNAPLAGPLTEPLWLGVDPFGAADHTLVARDAVLIPRLQICLVLMGAWWTLFSLPALFLLRDRAKPNAERKSLAATSAGAFEQIAKTLRSVRTYRMLFLFLIAFLIYNDGVQTIITQASVFAQEVFHIGAGDLVQVVLMIQFVSMPGALFMGWLANKWGEKQTLLLCIGIYIAWLFAAFFISTLGQFWVMGVVLALIMGGIQSVSRAIMGQMTPPSRSGEFFGFFNLSGKATSFAGPIVFGSILAWSGQPHLAILSLLPFFLIGGGLAWWIDMQAGRRQAELEG